MSQKTEIQLKQERLQLLEAKRKLQRELPHLYGFKDYWWSRTFIESTHRINFMTAANQMGKSSAQIRKAIKWATDTSLWPQLWPGKTPTLFFYVYPSIKMATREVNYKWIPEFLPKGEIKSHPQYGWRAEYKNNEIQAIHFNSGISIVFLSYQMNAMDLQGSSPHAVFCDEEIPVAIYPELVMRLEATKGYFHLVCTPTLGQPFFREIFERKVTIPDALVLTPSLYDAVTYDDGSPGMYTLAEVKRREALLGSEQEIQLRIFGRFVKTEGLVYGAFTRDILKTPTPVPEGWLYYSGIDVGSGGANNHPAAIAIIAIKPDFTLGRVIKLWRGDNSQVTTAQDIVDLYKFMRKPYQMAGEFYDWAAKDFETIALRAGIPVQKAEKSHDVGITLLNTLFKNEMLLIDDTPEAGALVDELENLRVTKAKRHAQDDQIDSVRYAVAKIPWNFDLVNGFKPAPEKPKPDVRSRAATFEEEGTPLHGAEEEIEMMNAYYEVD